MAKCSQYIQNIADYIDGEIDQALCAQLEEHLKSCRNCRIMVDTLRQTVVLCRGGKKEPLPPQIEKKLNQSLKIKWDKKFGGRRRR